MKISAQIKYVVLIVFLSPMLGCSMSDLVMTAAKPMMSNMQLAINKSDNLYLIREGMPANLIVLDGLLESSPNNEKLLITAAEANCGYALAFVEEDDRESAKRFYLKSRQYGFRALTQRNPQFKDMFNQTVNAFLPLVQDAEKEDVPALFWTAIPWFQWIKVNVGEMKVLKDIPKVEALLQRVLVLDETYYNGMAHMALGAYYAYQPQFMGGQPAKAKFHFQRAFEISESKLLMVHLNYAKFYLVQIQDQEAFKQTLAYILSAPEDLLPEKTFSNLVSKQKAQKVLENMDDYF